MRLDMALVERGLAASRHRARLLVDEGAVTINGTVADKASRTVRSDDVIEVQNAIPYVSRAGLKLAHALETFSLDPAGLDCLDVGSSTGGFTDVLLRHGAAHVTAVDVGTNQLHASLRDDPRVSVFERTDIRNFSSEQKFDLIVMDASFISQTLIVPKLAGLSRPGTVIVTLIKPQFEVGREGIGKGGIVASDQLANASVRRVIGCYLETGFEQLGETIDSPILGGDGNREYVAAFRML